MPSERRHEDRRPQLLGPGDVLLVEVDDRAPQPVLDAAGTLADDRADDARGRRDLERREQVRHRRRQAHLPVDRPSARPRTSASARARAGRASAGRAIIAMVTGKNVRYVAMMTTEVRPRTERDHDDRRERHDRDRLAGDDVRHEAPARAVAKWTKSVASTMPMSVPSDEADGRLTPRVERRARRGTGAATTSGLRWNGSASAPTMSQQVRQLEVGRLDGRRNGGSWK